MSDADVVVVGAGPAGAATAIRSMQLGLRVLIVERQPLPRDRVGETLHPGVEGPLRALGVLDRVDAAGFLRHAGVWHVTEGASFTPYGADEAGPWRGYQAWRARFDALLVERAQELGAQMLQARAQRPLLDGRRVVGLETSSGTLRAPLVVDAAGGGHWLARRLGLRIHARTPRLVATWGYARGDAPVAYDAPVFAMRESWWQWIARVDARRVQWTRLDLDPARPRRRVPPAELAGLDQTPSRSTDVTWRRVEPAAGRGYLLVGDAAAVLDPASSHGVLRSLLGGLAAGTVAAMDGDGAVAAVRAGYNTWLRRNFEHDVAALRRLYAELPRVPTWLQEPRTGLEHESARV